MTELEIWDVTYGEPQRFQRGSVALEEHLENWIEQDPSLVQPGLIIVGRQLETGAGPLDLLALDPFGNWVVIEIKRNNVDRDTIAQVIHYESRIAQMPTDILSKEINKYLKKTHQPNLQTILDNCSFDESIFLERRTRTFIVGTGRNPSLEGIITHLRNKGSEIQVITFDIFENDLGQRLIIRQLTEPDNNPSQPRNTQSMGTLNSEVERLFHVAEENGVGGTFRLIYDEATHLGLYPRTYKWSIMYTPPTNKTRVLFCTWVKPKQGLLKIWITASAFSEFFPVSDKVVFNHIGKNRYDYFDFQKAKSFIKDLKSLFEQIEKEKKIGTQ